MPSQHLDGTWPKRPISVSILISVIRWTARWITPLAGSIKPTTLRMANLWLNHQTNGLKFCEQHREMDNPPIINNSWHMYCRLYIASNPRNPHMSNITTSVRDYGHRVFICVIIATTFCITANHPAKYISFCKVHPRKSFTCLSRYTDDVSKHGHLLTSLCSPPTNLSKYCAGLFTGEHMKSNVVQWPH